MIINLALAFVAGYLFARFQDPVIAFIKKLFKKLGSTTTTTTIQ